MWLEIEDTVVVGVHSDPLDNDHEWIEYHGDANPGDTWLDGRVIPFEPPLDPMGEKRRVARTRIVAVYPEWHQLNILRSGDEQLTHRMGMFIDAVRDWSNDPDSTEEQFKKIQP